jgi:pimeloyl-ACP methyl ester carboxylesterase
VEELSIEVDGSTLAASYSPAGEMVVVALQGAGAGTRDDPLYAHLHELLPPAGIGVVTFDRRGEGASTGDSSRGRFQQQAEDAAAVLRGVDGARKGFWGISQGGWIGPLAASRAQETAFLVLVASTGVPPGEQMFYANERQLRKHGYDGSVVARALDVRRRFEDHVHGREVDEDELTGDLAAGVDEPWWEHMFLPPVLLDEEGKRLWIQEMDYDPKPSFAQVRVPTLLFFGKDDSWSPVLPSAEAWRESGAPVEIMVIPGAEHDLRLRDGSLSPLYREKLVEWLSALDGLPG